MEIRWHINRIQAFKHLIEHKPVPARVGFTFLSNTPQASQEVLSKAVYIWIHTEVMRRPNEY